VLPHVLRRVNILRGQPDRCRERHVSGAPGHRSHWHPRRPRRGGHARHDRARRVLVALTDAAIRAGNLRLRQFFYKLLNGDTLPGGNE
jgi:hypothetical protein